MSDLTSGSGMRAWLEAAKADGPSAGARTKIWSGISGSTAAGAGVGLGGMGAAKMLVGGTLLGAAATVGIAATMIYIAAPDRAAKAAAARAGAAANGLVPSALVISAPSTRPDAQRSESPTTTAALVATGAPVRTGVAAARKAQVVRLTAPEDTLAREATLLDQARSALSRGDARTALRAVRAARDVPGGQLLPEELTVEQQALRKLGRVDQADGVEAELKTQYPESALAR